MRVINRGVFWGVFGVGVTIICTGLPLLLTDHHAFAALLIILGVVVTILPFLVGHSEQPNAPKLVLEGHFSRDPNDTEPQGIFIRNFGGPARAVRVQPFGMKGSDVMFDEIPLLLATDPARQLTPRYQGDRKSIWDAAVFIEIAKVEPLRIAKSVTGHLRVTGRPTRRDLHRMPLRIKYRDAHDSGHTNDEFYLQFVPSSTGVPQETRLVITRA